MITLILTSVLGVVLLYLGLFGNKQLLAPTAIVGLLAALVLNWTGWNPGIPEFPTMLRSDAMSVLFNSAMLVVTILIFLFGIDYYERMEENVAEHYALMVFSLTGGLLLTSYTNLLMLFLGIEILSIPLYILAGGKKRSYRSSEASFKYFLLGSFATAFLLMGIALIYGVTASFELEVIQAKLAGGSSTHILFLLGSFFVAIGLSFKVAAVPFHFWSPDVYEGAPTLVTTFMATVVKTAAFAGFYRFIHMTGLPPALANTLLVMTVMTLLVGNVVAMRQSQFKRLMAYSSIAHSGFLLMAILANNPQSSAQTLFYYTFTYALATLGLFVVLTLAKRAANGNEAISIFRGLFRANPWLAVVTMLLLLSLAGIPLTAGFVAKYQVFMLAIGAGFIKTAVFAVVMALVGIYYYVLVIREAFTPAEQTPVLVVSPLNWLVITLCGISVVAFAVWPLNLV